MTETPKQRKPRWLLWILLGCLLIPGAVILILSEQVDSVRLPEELKRAPIELEPAGDEAEAEPRRETRPTDRATAAMPEFKDYDAYLKTRLAREPGLESAALYLKLSKRMAKEKTDKDLTRLFNILPSSFGSVGRVALSPEQIQWLRAHADLIEQIHRFSRSGLLPVLTVTQRVDYHQRTGSSLPVASYAFLFNCEKLLNWDGLRRTQERDYPGASRALQDGLQLAGMLHGDDLMISHLILIAMLSRANGTIRSCLEDPDFPRDELARMLACLDQADASLNLPEMCSKAETTEYLERRLDLVRELARPTWRSPLYGWDRDEHPERYETNLRLPGPGNTVIMVPNLAEIVPKAFIAIRNRQHAPEALKEYDRMHLKVLASMKWPYAQFLKENQERESILFASLSPKNYLAQQTPNFLEFHTRGLATKTRLGLSRLGLALRVEPGKILAKRNDDLTSQPHHPWRDPFTEAPLQADLSSSPTLIWSLGPDLKDQRGLIEYDPSNGTVSGGDIQMRAPASGLHGF